MKNEKGMKLNILAFALAGGVTGLLAGGTMPNRMEFNYGMMNAGFGMGTIGMALLTGVSAGLFAWLYNTFNEKI